MIQLQDITELECDPTKLLKHNVRNYQTILELVEYNEHFQNLQSQKEQGIPDCYLNWNIQE